MKTLLTLAFLLLVLPALASDSLRPASDALRFEASTGICQASRAEEGSWWNGHYPTRIDLTDQCFQLGVSKAPWHWRGNDLGWRVAYVDMGRVRTDSVMAYRDEDQFSNPDGSQCEPSTLRGCVMRTVGGGHAYGISGGGLIERDVGRFKLGAEAGLFFFHNYFHVDQYSYGNAVEVAFSSNAESKNQDAEGWQVTPYLGASLRFGWLTASVRDYLKFTAHKRGCEGCSGITNGPAYQFHVGIAKAF